MNMVGLGHVSGKVFAPQFQARRFLVLIGLPRYARDVRKRQKSSPCFIVMSRSTCIQRSHEKNIRYLPHHSPLFCPGGSADRTEISTAFPRLREAAAKTTQGHSGRNQRTFPASG